MDWLSFVANLVTVVAGVIAVLGVVWAVSGRSKLDVIPQIDLPSPAPSLRVTITSAGNSPVRDLEINVGDLLDNGMSMSGGDLAQVESLSRGKTFTILGFDPAETSFGSPPGSLERLYEVAPGNGFYLNLQWQSPLFPWRRTSRTYVWTPELRYACALPLRLRGRRETDFIRRSTRPSPGVEIGDRRALSWPVRRAVLADDETFDQLVALRGRPAFVAFGASWQVKLWRDVGWMMNSFASRHPRLNVLLVSTDQCPELANRFSTNVVPVFKMIKNGRVLHSYSGQHSLPELESQFDKVL